MIDHDRLFKELLSTFFIEFIELFFPQVMTYLEPESITFLDKEVFTDVTAGDRYEADLLVKYLGKINCALLCREQGASEQGETREKLNYRMSKIYK